MKSNATFSFFRRRECLCRHSNPHPRRTWLAKGVRFREMAPGWFAGVAMAGRSSISVWIIGCTRFFTLDAGLQVYEVEILMLNLSTPPSSKVPFTLSLCEAIVDSRDEPVDTRDSEAV